VAGSVNTGGGGGANHHYAKLAQAGGSGLVLIRWPA
jgi:hypothetical protein